MQARFARLCAVCGTLTRKIKFLMLQKGEIIWYNVFVLKGLV